MKNLFNAFASYLESMGRVRAAIYFTRIGKYDEAKRIMNND